MDKDIPIKYTYVNGYRIRYLDFDYKKKNDDGSFLSFSRVIVASRPALQIRFVSILTHGFFYYTNLQDNGVLKIT